MFDLLHPVFRSRSRKCSLVPAMMALLLPLCDIGQVFAQSEDCIGLRAQLASLDQSDPGRTAQFDAAVQRQRDEITRTTTYAKSIGCDRKQFLFFGEAPPAQCPQINAQIAKMNGNLQQLQAQSSVGVAAQRQELTARYQTYCTNAAPRPSQGLSGQGLAGLGNAIQTGLGLVPPAQIPNSNNNLPNTMPNNLPNSIPPNNAQPLLNPDGTPQLGPDGQPLYATQPEGGAKAVCVRTCDGGFFPVSYNAARARYDQLNELCHAMCPNAQTTLYTYSLGREIDMAVSIDGTPYINHPNAFKFRKSFDPNCGCKPPGQSWAQALADAERLLNRDGKSDVIVTVARAAELSRVQEPKADGKSSKDKKPAKTEAPKPQSDEASANESAVAAQVPTASQDSAGISANDLQGATRFGLGQGQTKDVVESDGTAHKVRVIGPKL